MSTINLEFYECEHGGDLDNYMNDIIECGGTITDSQIDYDSEVGYVEFEVADKVAFVNKFKETDTYEFIN